VVDRQGNLIAFHDISRVLRGENVRNLGEVSEFVASPSSVDVTIGQLYTGLQGTTVVGSFVPLGTPDWAVVIEMPWAEAYQEVIRNVVTSIVVIVVMAGLAAWRGPIWPADWQCPWST